MMDDTNSPKLVFAPSPTFERSIMFEEEESEENTIMQFEKRTNQDPAEENNSSIPPVPSVSTPTMTDRSDSEEAKISKTSHLIIEDEQLSDAAHRDISVRRTIRTGSAHSIQSPVSPKVEDYAKRSYSLNTHAETQKIENHHSEHMPISSSFKEFIQTQTRPASSSFVLNSNTEDIEMEDNIKRKLNDHATPSRNIISKTLNKLKSPRGHVNEQAPPPETEEDEDNFLDDIIFSSPQSGSKSYIPAGAQPTKKTWIENTLRSFEDTDLLDAFFVSVQDGDIENVRKMIEEKGVSVNTKDANSYGQSAMHYACWGGNLQMVEFLLSEKAQVNICNDVSRA